MRADDEEGTGGKAHPFEHVHPALEEAAMRRACLDFSLAAVSVAAWFGLRAEYPGAAAVALHALRGRAARIVAGRCRCGIAVAEDHVADAVFVMVYGIRRAPQLRISATTTLGYLCGVARNEWRWDRWRRARETGVETRRGLRTVIDV